VIISITQPGRCAAAGPTVVAPGDTETGQKTGDQSWGNAGATFGSRQRALPLVTQRVNETSMSAGVSQGFWAKDVVER
jgi:hypothetical protein